MPEVSESSRSRFAPRSANDLTDLVRANPLAWLASSADGRFLASPLPLLPVVADDGRLTSLIGHFARANPQLAMIERDPRALALFLGDHGYISASWLHDRTQAPTWNYASACFTVDVVLQPGPDAAHAAIELLVNAMEEGRPTRWRIDEMGARYQRLLNGVVAFEAKIVETHARFKLGQDERDDVYADIVAAVTAGGAAPLLEWMQRFNPTRAQVESADASDAESTGVDSP